MSLSIALISITPAAPVAYRAGGLDAQLALDEPHPHEGRPASPARARDSTKRRLEEDPRKRRELARRCPCGVFATRPTRPADALRCTPDMLPADRQPRRGPADAEDRRPCSVDMFVAIQGLLGPVVALTADGGRRTCSLPLET